jgi:hypothetical protein
MHAPYLPACMCMHAHTPFQSRTAPPPLHPFSSPNHVRAPQGYCTFMQGHELHRGHAAGCNLAPGAPVLGLGPGPPIRCAPLCPRRAVLPAGLAGPLWL